ncbi:MBL fold metallo-hydrolase [Coprobacillus sp. AF21-8LB]|nr:MBL fold metallo-hydrolase [Coprobacillus sp. AF21-8LB]
MIIIKVLKAHRGDCIFLSYGKEKNYNILIDGGEGKAGYRQLNSQIDKLKLMNEKIDLLVLTHFDSDHIAGIIRLFSKGDFDYSIVKKIWFNFGTKLDNYLQIKSKLKDICLEDNSSKISWRQGKKLEEKLYDEGIEYEIITKLYTCSINDATITVLSPSKEVLKRLADEGLEEKNIKSSEISSKNDYIYSMEDLLQRNEKSDISLSNKSSIAFLFSFNSYSILFLADSDPQEIIDSLKKLGYSKENRLKIDFCKISHHASKHNTSNELIQIIDCKNYIISTQMTSQGRPSKECLTRIICNSKKELNFYCNYEINWNTIFTKEEFDTYKMKFYCISEEGIILER